MQPTYDRSYVLNIVLLTEAALVLLATVWIYIAHLPVLELLTITSPSRAALILVGVAIGAATSLGSWCVSSLASRFKEALPWLSAMDELLQRMLVPLFEKATLSDILLIALSSGFCEEVFFRGVLQTQFGIVIASAIFASLHFPGKRYFFYVVWSFLAGLLFGFLMDFYHCLWVPIAAHAANNLISISIIRYRLAR